jgi:hypothetical protein
MRRHLVSPIVVSAAAFACSRAPAAATADDAAPPAPVATASTGAPSASSSAAPTLKAAKPVVQPASAAGGDFVDLFGFAGADAGLGDPSLLTTRSGSAPYVNARFGFRVDVPKAFTAMPEPENGDGQRWQLGDLAVMSASGIIVDMPVECASSSNVTAHKESANDCWATGKRDGYIFWEKKQLKGKTTYSLLFQYKESLKAKMDPIVTHANDSWRI